MLSEYSLKKYLKTSDKSVYKLSEDENDVLDKETGERICSFNIFLMYMKHKLHCNFESIYEEHGTLQNTLRCKDCGCVIFASESCEDYDEDLRCPVCCNDPSVCHFKYWTKDEIDSDEVMQRSVKFMMDETERKAREYARYKVRGLWDRQRWRKTFKIGHKNFRLTLINPSYDGDTKKCRKPVDRYLEISTWTDEEGIIHSHDIPMSWYNFYIRFIYVYSKKCHPSVRKYHFWQKKPEEE